MTDPVTEAVDETIAAHADQVERWRASEPGAWGYLAGQGVIAYRRQLGRKLTSFERRTIWEALWAELERRRQG